MANGDVFIDISQLTERLQISDSDIWHIRSTGGIDFKVSSDTLASFFVGKNVNNRFFGEPFFGPATISLTVRGGLGAPAKLMENVIAKLKCNSDSTRITDIQILSFNPSTKMFSVLSETPVSGNGTKGAILKCNNTGFVYIEGISPFGAVTVYTYSFDGADIALVDSYITTLNESNLSVARADDDKVIMSVLENTQSVVTEYEIVRVNVDGTLTSVATGNLADQSGATTNALSLIELRKGNILVYGERDPSDKDWYLLDIYGGGTPNVRVNRLNPKAARTATGTMTWLRNEVSANIKPYRISKNKFMVGAGLVTLRDFHQFIPDIHSGPGTGTPSNGLGCLVNQNTMVLDRLTDMQTYELEYTSGFGYETEEDFNMA